MVYEILIKMFKYNGKENSVEIWLSYYNGFSEMGKLVGRRSNVGINVYLI